MIKIKWKQLYNDARIPVKKTDDAAAFDLSTITSCVIKPGEIFELRTGLASEIPSGWYCQVKVRSGDGKAGMILSSSGVIDADYRGEWIVPLRNLGDKDFHVDLGQRIAQVLVLPVPEVEMELVDELSATVRGAGGFGHTGKM